MGKYAGAVGTTSCVDCSPGLYSDQLGTSACTSCVPGTYVATAGSSACAGCTAGQAQAVAGQTTCVSCQAGAISPYGRNYPMYLSTSSTAGIDVAMVGYASLWHAIGMSFPYTSDMATLADPARVQPVSQYAPQKTVYPAQANASQALSSQLAVTIPSLTRAAISSMLLGEACMQCFPGLYMSSTRRSYCYQCFSGTYQDGMGQYQCKQCASWPIHW